MAFFRHSSVHLAIRREPGRLRKRRFLFASQRYVVTQIAGNNPEGQTTTTKTPRRRNVVSAARWAVLPSNLYYCTLVSVTDVARLLLRHVCGGFRGADDQYRYFCARSAAACLTIGIGTVREGELTQGREPVVGPTVRRIHLVQCRTNRMLPCTPLSCSVTYWHIPLALLFSTVSCQ